MADGMYLGIEFGSTRIKAVLIDSAMTVLASGSHTWENQLVDGYWTYSLDAVWAGVQAAYAELAAAVQATTGRPLTRVDVIGVSAMMHGYLPFDAEDRLLVPFRTWRNTTTAQASADLTQALDFAIPQRWSIAHLYQAVLNGEAHVPQIDFVTTLAGYVHWRLTGQKVLGVGDASGMFPIDSASHQFDKARLATTQRLLDDHGVAWQLGQVLPAVVDAGVEAGQLSPEGARLLDPSGTLRPGTVLAPPEGDAGTGMVATNAVAPRTGNISAGTSIFAMVVLERALKQLHPEIDLVTTPSGDAVAMVHCNNGASEIDAWAKVFADFAAAAGRPLDSATVFTTLFQAALAGAADGGGLLAYNYLAGEPITGTAEGRPLIVRAPDSDLSLANLARTLIMSAFGTLALGMKILDAESVEVDAMFAHGGVFATKGVAQRLLAATLGAKVSVGQTAAEGGAWGMAVLAAFVDARAELALPPFLNPRVDAGPDLTLPRFLDQRVFAGAAIETVAPDPDDIAGFQRFLARYEAGLAVERAAIDHT